MGRLDRAGGALAILISAGLLVMVLVRDVGLTVFNGWTVALGAGGGVVVWRGRGRWPRSRAVVMIIVGALPVTVFTGLGLVYLVPIALIAGSGVGHGRVHAARVPGSSVPQDAD